MYLLAQIDKKLIIDSLQYCIKNKGLIVFAYCLMPSHLHMICKAEGNVSLSDVLRDFKTFTSKNVISQIQEEPESRREWMLEYFSKACLHLKKGKIINFGKMVIRQKKYLALLFCIFQDCSISFISFFLIET